MNALTAQIEIQTLIETYRQAVIAKDVEKVMALYAADIVSFEPETLIVGLIRREFAKAPICSHS